MTLHELINQLQGINYKVTSTDFETNVLSVKATLEGDWHNWLVKLHTADEERLEEEGEELAYNCEKRMKKAMIDKACEWLKGLAYIESTDFLLLDQNPMRPEIQLDVDAMIEQFKQAMEE